MADSNNIHLLLDKAVNLSRDKHSWSKIQNLLDDVVDHLANSQNLVQRAEVTRKISAIRHQREEMVDKYLTDAETLLNETPLDTVTIDTLLNDAIRLTTEQKRIIVEEKVNKTKSHLMKKVEAQERINTLQRVTHQVDDLILQGEAALRQETSHHDAIEQFFGEAYRMADREQAINPGIEAFQVLTTKAKQRYDTERDNYNITTTYSVLGRFADQLEVLRALQQTDPDRRVMIEDENNEQGLHKLDEAIRITNIRLSKNSDERFTTYKAQIEQYLRTKDPLAAQREIKYARDLPMLSPGALNDCKLLDEQIQVELSAYNRASLGASNALNEFDLSIAWSLLIEAKTHYETNHDVHDAWRKLKLRSEQELREAADHASRYLEIGRLDVAKTSIEEVSYKFMRIFDTAETPEVLEQTLKQLRDQLVHIEDESSRVDEVIERLERLTKASQYLDAKKESDAFLDRYPRADQRHRRFQQINNRIQLQVDIDRLPQMLEDAYHSVDIDSLSEAIHAAEHVMHERPDVITKYGIITAKNRLNGRLLLFKSIEKWEKDFDRPQAINLLQQVLRGSGVDNQDQAIAKDILKEHKEGQSLEDKLQRSFEEINQLVSEGRYREAYEKINPLMQDTRYLSPSIDQQRLILWDIISTHLANSITVDLANLVEDETEDIYALEELWQLLSKIETYEVPMKSVLDRAHERISILRARQSENNHQFEEACKYWQQAVAYNNDHYVHLVEARRRMTKDRWNEYKAHATTLEQAEQLVVGYIQSNPNAVEARVWLIKTLMERARLATNPRQFEALWQYARSTLMMSKDTVNQRKNDPKLALTEREAIDEYNRLEQQIKMALEDAHKLTTTIRMLKPHQSLSTLRKSSNDLTQFLQTHEEDYTGLYQWWWSQERPQLIAILQEPSLLQGEDAFWDEFLNRGRILAIAPEHEVAIELERQLGSIAKLVTQAQSALHNTIGMRTHPVENTVTEQIRNLTKLEEYLNNVLNSLRFLESQFQPEQLSRYYTMLENGELANKIQQKVMDSQSISEKFAQALAQAGTFGKKGNWSIFDGTVKSLYNLKNEEYKNHVVLVILNERKTQIIAKREQLMRYIKDDVIEAFNHQQLIHIQDVLDNFNEQNPADEFDLDNHIHVTEPHTGANLLGVEKIMEWLEKCNLQLDIMKEWLNPLVRRERIDHIYNANYEELKFLKDSTNLQEAWKRSQDGLFVDYPSHVLQVITPYCHSSDFVAAYQATLNALENDGDWQSLKKSVQLANRPLPVQKSNAISIHVALLVEFALMIRQLLNHEVNDAQTLLRRIQDEATIFVGLLNHFDAKLAELTGKPTETTRAEVTALYEQIKTLVPDYDGLAEQSDYPVLTI